jgi:hypothetical protein
LTINGTSGISGGSFISHPDYIVVTVNGSTVQSSTSGYISGSTLIINSISVADGNAANPRYRFSAETDTGFFRVTTDTVGLSLGGVEEYRWTLNGGNGDFHATGDIIAFSTTPSDLRLKDNIFTLNDNTLELVKKIRPVSYTWKNKDNNKKDFGVVAQEIEQLLPEIVKEKELLGQKEGEKFKTVSYEKLIPFLIKAIQELSDEVDKLKKER